MSTFGRMQWDIAERLAATAVEDVTVEKARRIIESFLHHISRCPLCDNTGEYTMGRDVDLPVMGPGRETNHQYFAKGTTGPCPRCGPPYGGYGAGDPEYVAWVCSQGDTVRACQAAVDGEGNGGRKHEDCGFRVCLPVPRTQPLQPDAGGRE